MLEKPNPEITDRFRKWRSLLAGMNNCLCFAKGGELPGGRLEMLALCRAVRDRAAFFELGRGPFDQLLDEPCEKFARSAVLSSICSRSQLTAGLP